MSNVKYKRIIQLVDVKGQKRTLKAIIQTCEHGRYEASAKVSGYGEIFQSKDGFAYELYDEALNDLSDCISNFLNGWKLAGGVVTKETFQ